MTKETFKQTPHEMICKEIIYHALDMLDNHEISIRQISEELNFVDMASFSKFFKNSTFDYLFLGSRYHIKAKLLIKFNRSLYI